MSGYLSYFKYELLVQLQYRAAALAGILTQIFWGFIYALVYIAFYNHTSIDSINLSELMSYVWLNQAFIRLIYLSYKDNEIMEKIKTKALKSVGKEQKIEKKVVNIAREVDKIKKEAQPGRKEQPNEKVEVKEEQPKKEELALKPVKPKKEKKPFNIFQFFKDKDRKKRKEILNRVMENKVDDYETISTKTKLSKGSIAVDDVDANELDPLIDLYRDSNKKLRNRIKESQL